MKLHQFLILLVLVSFVGACDFYDERLNIKNNSNYAIAFDYSIDTLLKYDDWEYIRTHRLYQRYSFTEEELNRINWIIEYPQQKKGE